MEAIQLRTLAELRTVIGYLGEREQFGWWSSAFFGTSSRAFLAPVFARTQTLAQCVGVTQAAAVVHDERIGVGQVFHLFRLPEDIEQGIHGVLLDRDLSERIAGHVANKDAALAYLAVEAKQPGQPNVGPTRVGGTQDLRDLGYWRIVAGCYLFGFGRATQIFPYFADRSQ